MVLQVGVGREITKCSPQTNKPVKKITNDCILKRIHWINDLG
jgi:hypothetical protein